MRADANGLLLSSLSAFADGLTGNGCLSAAGEADWALAKETELRIGNALQLMTMTAARADCLRRRFPACAKVRDGRGVAMRPSGPNDDTGLAERIEAATVGGQQRSAFSCVLALEKGENGRQDDQRSDGPARQAADHGAPERGGLRAGFA